VYNLAARGNGRGARTRRARQPVALFRVGRGEMDMVLGNLAENDATSEERILTSMLRQQQRPRARYGFDRIARTGSREGLVRTHPGVRCRPVPGRLCLLNRAAPRRFVLPAPRVPWSCSAANCDPLGFTLRHADSTRGAGRGGGECRHGVLPRARLRARLPEECVLGLEGADTVVLAGSVRRCSSGSSSRPARGWLWLTLPSGSSLLVQARAFARRGVRGPQRRYRTARVSARQRAYLALGGELDCGGPMIDSRVWLRTLPLRTGGSGFPSSNGLWYRAQGSRGRRVPCPGR